MIYCKIYEEIAFQGLADMAAKASVIDKAKLDPPSNRRFRVCSLGLPW